MKKLTIVTSAYRSEKYLQIYFENMICLTNLDEISIILLLNDATEEEKRIAEFYKKKYPNIFYIQYTPRESIGASTNRGFRLAKTLYVGYADVDDLRASNAFELQIKTLDENPDVDFTYGDFVVVSKIGQKEGKYINTQEFDINEFARSSTVGPGHLFRRSLLDKIGYWDEQLKSGGDFEFQIRAALNCKFKKTEGVLVYYLCGENASSASKNILQPIERTIIEIRYGIFDKIDYNFMQYIYLYNIANILQFGQWISIKQFVPNYDEFMENRRKNLADIGLYKYCRNQILTKSFFKKNMNLGNIFKLTKN